RQHRSDGRILLEKLSHVVAARADTAPAPVLEHVLAADQVGVVDGDAALFQRFAIPGEPLLTDAVRPRTVRLPERVGLTDVADALVAELEKMLHRQTRPGVVVHDDRRGAIAEPPLDL